MNKKLYIWYRYSFTLLYLYFSINFIIAFIVTVDKNLSFLNSICTNQLIFLSILLVSSLFSNWIRKKYADFLYDKKSIVKEPTRRKTNLLFTILLWSSMLFLLYWSSFRGSEGIFDNIIVLLISSISLVITVFFPLLKVKGKSE